MNHDSNTPPPAVLGAYLGAFRTFLEATAATAAAPPDEAVPAIGAAAAAFLADPAVKELAAWAGRATAPGGASR